MEENNSIQAVQAQQQALVSVQNITNARVGSMSPACMPIPTTVRQAYVCSTQ